MPRKTVLALVLLLIALSTAPLAAVDPDLLAGMKARSIGPAGMSGRVAAIAAVESNPDVVYVGAASGGVWKSINGGLTWEPLFDDQPVASIGAVSVFQPNPDVVWVGTGEGNPRNSVSVGNGVYKSLDGGRTWIHLGLEKTERIHRIVLHPTNPDVAWVSALGQAWGENPERGVFKTEDGGRTWTKVLYVDEKTGASDLVMDPKNPNKLFASMWQYRRWPWLFKSGGPGSGLYVTHDGGKSWKKITEDDGLPKGDLGRIGLAVSPADPNIVYAMVEASKSALVRSRDGGKTWQTVNDRWDVNPRPFYFGDIRADPVHPDRVYSLDYTIRVSDDGGKTFSTLVDWNLIHGDHHALWIDPNDPERMYVGNDGGVAVSHDGGRTSAFVGNLPLAQYYHVSVDMETPYNVYGGLQDNGSWRGPSSVWQGGGIRNYLWQEVGGGDGFDVQPDPADANIVYSMSQGGHLGRINLRTREQRAIRPPAPDGVQLRFNWNAGLAMDPFAPGTLYYGSQFLHKSTDRGETWTIISPDLTTDNPEWQKQDTSGGLTPDVTAAENHTTIIAIAPSAVERGVIWVGTDDGRLHVTRDGGTTWTGVEGNVPGVPRNTWIPHIRASKHKGGGAFVVFDNHRRSDWTPYVVRTDDYGRTWKSIATKDLRGYALAIEQDPVKEDLLFLGTEFGLWFTLDGGRTWMQWTHGVPTVSVMDLALHSREHDLVIATHGRALFVLDDIRPLRELSDETLARPLHLHEIAAAQQHSWSSEPGGYGLGSGEFRGQNRPYGALLTFSLSDPKLPLPDDEKERERKEAERAAKRKEEAEKEARTERQPKTARELREQETAGKQADEPEEKKEEEKPPKAEIRVADASGRTIRTFTAPVKRGLNRAVWSLNRDAFKLLPSEEPPPENPGGFEVVPGDYTVTVKYGDQEAKGTVRVLPDPHAKNTEADWKTREEAIDRVIRLNDLIVEGVQRIRRTRSDVQTLADRHEQAKKEKDEKDKKDPKDEVAKKDETPDPLAESAGKLQKSLTDLEKRLWIPYDTVGIVPETDAASKVFYPLFYVVSSWAPPSPTHLEYLRQAEAEVAKVLEDFNRFFETDVAAFRKAVDEAGIRLLEPGERLEVKRN
ncbi:MAG TPA: hypothetical protein VE685_21245 [Thermoanaerobaculia bacterium]|nr:hypothetical protein [Thermoanaerobaculia bacterium]